MPPRLSSEVFTPNDNPKLTYVKQGLHERLLEEWLRMSTQIASVSGPSKAGKTVLVKHMVGEDNLIIVSGASVRSADQLWDRVLDWWGEPTSTMTSSVETKTETETRERTATVGISGTGAQHKSGHLEATAGAETLQATVGRRGLPQVVAELANSKYTILLDDFHYIPTAIQTDVAQQLKDAASRGVRLCVASVPHRTENVVRALPELRGRVLAIDIDYWSTKELLEIPRLGLPQMGLEIDQQTLHTFAVEAAGSPQLMQMMCLWLCNIVGVREAVEFKAVTLEETKRKEVLFLTSAVTEFRTLVRALVAGPKVKTGERRNYIHFDGRVGDVYMTVMRAIAADPPRLSIDYPELTRRLDVLCKGAAPDGASVINACTRMAQIAQGFVNSGGPALEWDEQAQTIVLADPYLLYYLRWSVILEREADGLI